MSNIVFSTPGRLLTWSSPSCHNPPPTHGPPGGQVTSSYGPQFSPPFNSLRVRICLFQPIAADVRVRPAELVFFLWSHLSLPVAPTFDPPLPWIGGEGVFVFQLKFSLGCPPLFFVFFFLYIRLPPSSGSENFQIFAPLGCRSLTSVPFGSPFGQPQNHTDGAVGFFLLSFPCVALFIWLS